MAWLLYIDDDPDDRELLTDLVKAKRPEVEVSLCETGSDGLITLQKRRDEGKSLPCVIVLDVNMPGWNGIETFQRMRAEPEFSNIPVAILTTSANPRDRRFFDNEKAVHYFSKATDLSRLSNILSEILTAC